MSLRSEAIFNSLRRSFFLISLVLIVGCSNQTDPQDYMTTFDHILTDQYIWSYGRGGIYWVSNEHIVLEAHITDDSGALDRGLYQVDTRDGSYLKVVDVPEKGPFHYKYCFDGETLHVEVEKGDFKEVVVPAGYQIAIREKSKKTSKGKNRRYSPFRCRFVESPEGESGYWALGNGDGFLKYQREEGKRHVYLVNESGAKLKKLIEQDVISRVDINGMFSVNRYFSREQAYFGYSSWDSEGCSTLWWLYKTNWRIERKQICLGENIAGGTRLIHDLNSGLLLEHYGGRKGRIYVLLKDKELLIEENHGRGASVSPDKCMVAYGEGKLGSKQKLKILSYCKYQQKG